ncbi:MAG: NAD(P)/FAD-dependent oxidoreductase [Taibaiella sp.]|nr:NAD(P)/FAD-dependent oxidoreductase [Taibaiella sp.]
MKQDIHDVIIIGGGPAGCNAAIVLARSRRSVLIIDEGKQRNLRSQGMHNYLTRDGVLPTDYIAMAHKELNSYKIPILQARAIKARMLATHGFEVIDNQGNKHLCRRLLMATGVTDKIPDIPGMKELWGCGVYHCPFCDGWECHKQPIGLYARDYNGYGMAQALQHLSGDVILFTDGRQYLKPNQKAHLKALGIKVVAQKVKELAIENKKLLGVVLENGELVPLASMFVEHGHIVNDDLLKQLGCNCTNKGAAITNRQQRTSIPGLYVAGDAAFDIHFVIVAAAEGAKAAVAIHNDLLKTDNLEYA